MQDGSVPGAPDRQPEAAQPPAAPPQPPPGPPPSQYTTSPAEPQASVASQPAASAEPPAAPKKRTGLWIGLGVGIVALLALCGCAAVVIGFMGSAADTTKKYEAAEVHYAAAVTALAVLDDAEQLASADDLATMADEWDAKVTPGVEAAQKELELAAAELDDVDESEAKTAYLASLKSSQALLSEMGKLSDELDTLADVGQDIDSLGKRLVKANASLDSAVADTQDRKWGSCITKAESARANYRTAEAQLRKLHKRYSSFGFNRIAADTAIRRQAAERIIAVAKAGRAGNISRANDLIGSYNALARRTGKVDTDALEPNALLENFWASYKEISKQLIAAEVAHDQAIKAIESGKY